MRPPFRIQIPVAEAIVDKTYTAYYTTDSNTCCHCNEILYKGNGCGWMWGESDRLVKNITKLERPLTDEEISQWYIEHFDINDTMIQANVCGLFHDMYDVGDASHQLWNAWVSSDFYTMNNELINHDIYLIGIAPAPYGTWTLEDPVALVIEDKDTFERYWCHGERGWVSLMRLQMREIYNNISEKEY